MGYSYNVSSISTASPCGQYALGNDNAYPCSIPQSFKGEEARDTYVSSRPEQKKPKTNILLTAGILAAAAAISLNPKARYAARNLLGEKGLDKFLENKNVSDDLKTVMNAFKDNKEFISATQDMSASNIKNLAAKIKDNSDLYQKLINGKISLTKDDGEAIKLINLAEHKGYDLYHGISKNKDLIDNIVETQKLIKDGGQLSSISYSSEAENVSDIKKNFEYIIKDDSGNYKRMTMASNSYPWENVPKSIRELKILNNAKDVKINL